MWEHATVFIRIDPSIPVVWRDSETVQLGLDPEYARLGPLDLSGARGVTELVRGTSLARLASIVGGEHVARSLIDSCGDVFHRSPRAILPRLAVVGVAPATDTIARTWAGSTRSTVVAASSADITAVDVDFVLLVSHFVVSPIDIQPWLGRDINHCAIVFGESSVRVGPVVRPGETACIRCVELAHIDSDPTWSAVAPQMWRRNAAADSIDLAIHAAAESLSMFPMGGGYSVRVDGVTFNRAVSPHALHPDCGCCAIPDVPE
jgi:hypothetical protein